MFSIERWQEIFEGLFKNKLRTVLTGVSVASGIFILVILLGAGNGIQNGIQKQFEQDAVNRISVWPGITQKEYNGLGIGREIQLHNSDYTTALTLLSDHIEYKSAVYSVWSGNMVFKKETGTYRVEGVHPDYQFIENASIVKGRFLNQSDIANYEKHVVIGQKVANDLFKGEEELLGQELSISGTIYKVIGVFTDPGGEREESRVYIPISTAQRAYSAGDKIRSIVFTLKRNADFDNAVAESHEFTQKLETFLRARHTIAPDDKGALHINNSLDQAKNIYIITGGVKAFFWFVGICTIIAGVVGVGNIMLIIVKERTKEIGIRKALGASPFSIISMILQEAVFITVVAGFSGLVFGLLVWEFVGPSIETDFFTRPEVDFNVAITTLVILVVAGAFAGFVPAYRAAKIRPIIALRGD
ncbi:ABC transporter permease [Sphingobacterium tabacisoli]|uniref:ABC transporter permease n=1 Tax=Sphingobacterium tabacisoli TaxID=2044855 RepID=A0ABW5L7N5_9SPHI|nr:ABC transporter permease [Sphingobacterium tabacisoli]